MQHFRVAGFADDRIYMTLLEDLDGRTSPHSDQRSQRRGLSARQLPGLALAKAGGGHQRYVRTSAGQAFIRNSPTSSSS